MAAAQQLYENFDRAHALSGSTAEPVQAFESYVNFFQAKLTGLEVDYDFAHGCFSGRRYSTTPSLQGVPKWIRDTIAGEIYYDIDMVNSRPTIAAEICRRIGFDYAVLQDYVANRAACIARWTGATLSTGETLTADTVKQYFLAVLGGSTATSDNAELAAHCEAAKRLHKAVWDLDAAAAHRKNSTKRYAGKDWDNKYASCFTRVCDDIENGIIVELQRAAGAHGVQIGSLEFDGIRAYRRTVADIGATVRAFEAHLRTVFGFAVGLKVKPPAHAVDLRELPAANDQIQPERAPRAADKFDSLSNCELVGDNEQRTYNSQVVPDDGCGDLYVSSNCGTGKNFHVAQIVRRAYAALPGTKTIAVSPRKTLTYQTLADFRAVCPAATSYQNISGAIDLQRHPFVVCQLDSIERFDADTAPDLLILDELSATISHAMMGKPHHLTKLRKLVATAGRLIVTDADLTDNHVELLRKWRAGSAGDALARVFRNVFQPWAGRAYEIVEGRNAEVQVAARLLAFVAAAAAARAAGAEFSSCVVPCHSRKTAEKMAGLIRSLYPGYPAVKLYTGETDDHEKIADFCDAEAAWTTGERPYAIVYTGTVSVGVSCNSPLIGECFAFFCTDNAAVPQSVQMMFRARQLAKFTVAFAGRKAFPPQTPAGVAKWLTLARNRSEIPATLRDDLAVAIEDVYGRTTTDPAACLRVLESTFEGGLFLGDRLERHRSAATFTARLAANLERAGLVRVQAEAVDPGDTKARLVGAKQDASAADCERVAAPESLNAARAALEHDREGGPQSAAEKAGRRLLFLANSYKVDPNVLTGDWVHQFEPAVAGYNRLKRQLAGAALPAGAVDVGSPQEAGKLLTEFAAAVGADLTADRASFAADRLDPAANAAVRPLFDRINVDALRVLGDTNGKRRAKTGPSRRPVVAALDAVLRYYAGELQAEYPNERARKQGQPASYTIVYPWTPTPGGIQRDPNPAHPRPPAIAAEPAEAEGEGEWEPIPGGGGYRRRA